MKYIVDAQLSFRVSKFLSLKGFDVIHTLDLKDKDLTSDDEIRRIARIENRIIISKDSDFLDSYFIKKNPKKLLLITTGNINNRDLLTIFENNFDLINELFVEHSLIELGNDDLIIHE
ncbi:MAG: DUF5615 family PIN-like protein [Flavobacteriia bacterium]|jgi:predicted nuclease of predicted toxin-antitoxin system